MTYIKPVFFTLCLLPLLWLPVLLMMNGLGANPIEFLIRYLGDWGLRFLLIALAITPVRKATGFSRLATLRRMAGLYAFFYITLHLVMYVGVDLFFDFSALLHDVWKRKFITVGMLAFALLIPLAVTSTDPMVRRLGGRRWRALHRLVYIAAPLAVLHYFWMVKADVQQPLIYAVILAALLGARWPFPQIRARLGQQHP